MLKKLIITVFIINFMLIFSGTIVNAGSEEISNFNEIILHNFNECPINITVHEAWELLTDTDNGIQTPIDVRYEQEWEYGFIDTPTHYLCRHRVNCNSVCPSYNYTYFNRIPQG